jgi:integrase
MERAVSLRRIKPTKTYEEREVDVTPHLLQTIQQHLTWLFKRALKDAKVPAFRLCDLRHTYASLLLAERAPITYVAEQLGHANPSTTLRYYAKWIPSKGQWRRSAPRVRSWRCG